MNQDFYRNPKYIAAIVLLILYCFPVFSFAMGYSGYGFTRVAIEENLLYAVLYLVPAGCIYLLAAHFFKNEKNHSFYRFEKYSGVVILIVLFFVQFIMLFGDSFWSLGFGFWLSCICGLIITFDRRIHSYLYKLKN